VTQKQKESVAKYLYDVSKLSYTGLVLYGFLTESGPSLMPIVLGLFFGAVTFLIAYALEGD